MRSADLWREVQPAEDEEVHALRKMTDVTPRRGPSIVVIDAQVGQRTRAPSLWCDHEWETVVYEAPIPRLSRCVIRCRYCHGMKSRDVVAQSPPRLRRIGTP